MGRSGGAEEELVAREELPDWATEALRAYLDARRREDAPYYPRVGGLWRFRDGELSFWHRRGSQRRPSCQAVLVFLAGLATLGWAVAGLGDGEIDYLWFGLAAGLLVAGIVAFNVRLLGNTLPGHDGLLVTPDGLIAIEGEGYRAVPAERVEGFEVRDRELVARLDDAPPLLVQRAKDLEHERVLLAGRAELLDGWLHDRALSPPDPADPATTSRETSRLFYPAVLGIGAALFGAFTYVTVVVPERSEAGTEVRDFVSDLGAGHLDRAYDRLSAAQRDERPREGFEGSLPPSFLEATGYDINGLGHSRDERGVRTCIDGWLEGVSGHSGYAFVLVREGERLRIDGWARAACGNPWWH
ncbi:MAG TPA: hypothetical protein RMH99_12530 [Sandaracinaceae bacterium LLY-WYZ-13_1]|nr:hypothetical protein [Sandaracinaceae bacterium LLY-WYZ-13_1]